MTEHTSTSMTREDENKLLDSLESTRAVNSPVVNVLLDIINARTLNKDQRDWLGSLMRMSMRKLERELPRVKPYPGQPEDEFKAFVEHLEQKLQFARDTYTALKGGQ